MKKNSYIEILIQSLKRKNKVLDEVMEANQRQREALEDPSLDPDEFDKIVEEKSVLIEQLETLDNGFEEVFARIREELDDHKTEYTEEIHTMQDLIRQLTEQSAVIQTQEMQNKELMIQRFSAVKKQIREIRASQKIVNQYYRNMMKRNYVEPQFTDRKK